MELSNCGITVQAFLSSVWPKIRSSSNDITYSKLKMLFSTSDIFDDTKKMFVLARFFFMIKYGYKAIVF